MLRSLLGRLALACAGLVLLAPATASRAFAQAPVAIGGARSQSALSPADVARLAGGATGRSIVILRNQHADLPARGVSAGARANAVAGDQASVRRELWQLHAPDVRAYRVLNAASATLSGAEADPRRPNPPVRAVLPDLPMLVPPRAAAP